MLGFLIAATFPLRTSWFNNFLLKKHGKNGKRRILPTANDPRMNFKVLHSIKLGVHLSNKEFELKSSNFSLYFTKTVLDVQSRTS